MEIVCKVRSDALGQAGSVEPGILGLRTDGRILALRVPREESADIPLVRDCVGQLVVVIGAIKVPALGKVVVDAGNAKVTGLGSGDRTFVVAIVKMVTLAAGVGQRQILIPERDDRVQWSVCQSVCGCAKESWIAIQTIGAHSRLNYLPRRCDVASCYDSSATRVSDRKRVQIDSLAAEVDEPIAHGRQWHVSVEGGVLRVAETLVVAEEIPAPSQKVGLGNLSACV